MSKRGICAIALGDEQEILARDFLDKFPQAERIYSGSECEAIVAKVAGFVERPMTGLDVPLDIHGTTFQQRVWQALREVSAGSTASYSEIARGIGMPHAARAVAGACAANVLAVAIPCHRVLCNDGKLSG